MLLTKGQRSPVEFATKVAESRYFCVPSKHSRDEFVYLGGFEKCERDFLLERDTFPFLTLELITSGSGSLSLGDRKHQASPGMCFCGGPDIAFQLQSDNKDPLEKFFIVFGRDAFPARTHPKELYPGCVYQGVDPMVLRKWGELILEEGISQSSRCSENVSSLIDVLIRKISDDAEESLPAQGTDALVAKALRVIDSGFQTIRSAQELADLLGVSPEHLCRAFRRSQHATPYQVLTRRKMAHACTLLKLSPLTIQEIADSVGFSDAFHFSRAFKKQYGMPPSGMRRSVK
ncbi:AraC family transcriptional regulator [Pelagicoccus sp. SDUM812003]|uniref:AraC family transcriptional regulator n=1 Tax=Pelagicoccus sp. SDUM812003 TaxID=3041267 RepID=UPI00280EAB3A|nr:AraC family transcriptional regulator [Pelagicoccus sp. SDUM812003]MDQ8203230.1 AraC family transcriptional regulator [Pelagicoccus sp. SDUM812003]